MASSKIGLAASLFGLPAELAKYLPRAYSTGAISPAEVAAATVAEQTFTVTGLLVGDVVAVSGPASQTAGIGIAGARVSAANTLAIAFVNATAGALTPTASSTYLLTATRAIA